MSIQLTIPQMLDVLVEQDHPRAEGLIQTAVELAITLAELVQQYAPEAKFKIENIELWDGDILIGFDGEGPIPEALKGYDDTGW